MNEISVYPWHQSGYLHTPDTSLGTCRVPEEHLHAPDTSQCTCRVPTYPWHQSGYLQSTCIPLTLVRVPAEYLHTPDAGQGTRRVPWHQPRRMTQWLNVTSASSSIPQVHICISQWKLLGRNKYICFALRLFFSQAVPDVWPITSTARQFLESLSLTHSRSFCLRNLQAYNGRYVLYFYYWGNSVRRQVSHDLACQLWDSTDVVSRRLSQVQGWGSVNLSHLLQITARRGRSLSTVDYPLVGDLHYFTVVIQSHASINLQ